MARITGHTILRESAGKNRQAWVFYRDQKIEIADLFEDGICHVKLCGENGVLQKPPLSEKPLYDTIVGKVYRK